MCNMSMENIVFVYYVLNSLRKKISFKKSMAEIFSKSEDMMELPSNFYEASYLLRKNTLHNGTIMFKNSMQAHRTSNQAIILLYGLSGAGKTSSLNHLFGFELIKVTDSFHSSTKDVTEYIATMESDIWGVKNLQINFIDIPGWRDSSGENEDIRNAALIDQFLINHHFLGSKIHKCYPNIVAITINANENRLEGKDTEVVRMFRALTKLNVIDKERPNVLIIMTHAGNVGKKNFKQRLDRIIGVVRNLANCYLECDPKIVYVENDYEEYELERFGDWTILRDGTRQPQNVFYGMIEIMSKQQDEIGNETVRIYFTSRGNNKPIKKRYEHNQPSHDQIQKWSIIIKQEFSPLQLNEVNIALQKYTDSNSDQFSIHSLVPLMIELDKHALTQVITLQSMDLNQVHKIIQPYRLSKLENHALVKACGVKPYQFEDIVRIIGCGKNTKSGEVLNNSILELETSWDIQNGVRLPKCMHAVIPKSQCKRRIRWEPLQEEINQQGTISEAGDYTIEKITPKYQFQILHIVYNIRMYDRGKQLLLSHLNTAFKDAVLTLPKTSIEEGNVVRSEYIDFINKYGELIIVGCECGGIVQGEVQMDETEFRNIQSHLDKYIHSLLDMLETGTTQDAVQFEDDSFQAEARIFEIFDKTILKWKSGEVCGKSVTLNSLTTKQWSGWIHSLYKTPQMLSMDAASIPIHQFAALISSDISIRVKSACTRINEDLPDVIDGPNITISNTILEIDYNRTRESAAIKTISRTIQRANYGFPETATVIQRTSEKERCKTKLISEINVGDRVLCYNQRALKFLEVSEVNYNQSARMLDYMCIKHEHGELVIGHNHNILLLHPTSRVLAKDVQIGNNLFFINKTTMKVLTSKVTYIGIGTGRGRYSLKVNNLVSDSEIAVDQILTGHVDTTCFPGNATVLLEGGKRVRMDELKIGDYVLSIHPTTFKPVYSRVYLWAHRDPHNTATFLHITHPHGHLHISANHLILSGGDNTPIPAYQLRVGDSIQFMSHSLLQKELDDNDTMDSHTLNAVSVLDIHMCTQVGYYAPFTDNGLIVVDHIAASVYSQILTHSQAGYITRPLIQKFGMHRVAHCVLKPIRIGCKLGIGGVLSKQINENTNIHKYCQWLLLHC